MFGKKKMKEAQESHEACKRTLLGHLKTVILLIAIALSLFQLYTAAFGVFITSIVHRAVHLCFVLVLFFILYPVNKKAATSKGWLIYDIFLAAVSIFALGYLSFTYDNIAALAGNIKNLSFLAFIVAGLIIVLTLEANRRSNKVLFYIMLASLAYTFLGPYFPGPFSHPGISIERMLYLLSFSSEGIFGTGLSVSSTYLYLFILFGVFLGKTGVTDFFIKLALSLVGKYAGGPAKACVIGSSLMGTVTGSSIGNCVAVGAFTIPMMIRAGFQNHVAAAIEAISSIGGQLMPPVMGAAAFIMAEMTGISYGKVALAALIPALVYYINIFSIIHFEAVSNNMKGIPEDELPRLKEVLLSSGHLLIPLIILAYMLLAGGYTATMAGFVAIISCILVTYIGKGKRFKLKDFFEACEKGAYNAIEIAVLCAGIGIIISSIVLTGLGMRFATIAITLAGGQIIPLLLLTMVVSIILGMGMPTPVVYLLMAMFTAPSIVQMGVPVISAHLFVFYYAILSGLTPPVCLVSIVSAGIAQANWFQTGIKSTVYALPAFILPYIWIFKPELLMIGSTLEIILSSLTACLGTIVLAAAIEGSFSTKMNLLERFVFGVAGLLLICPGFLTDAVGLVIFLAAFVSQRRKKASLEIAVY